MAFQPQKRSNSPADVIALRSCTPHRTPLDPTILLDSAMVGLDRPNLACQHGAFIHSHGLVARGPIFRVTVWGVDPKHQDKAIAFQMDARASLANATIGQRPIRLPVRIDLSIGFQAREPLPAMGADSLEIGQTTVPTVEGDVAWLEHAL